jgi:F-type H+-transporting ATPase subunit b
MFDWWTFFFQTLNFFVVLYILYRLFFKPLKGVIEQREATVGERLGGIEKAEARLKADQAECEAQKQEIQRLRERTLDEAKEEALTEKDAMMKEASQEMAKAFEKQRGIIDQEREKYEKEIRRQSLEFGLFYTKKLIGELCDEALNEQRVDRFLSHLPETPPETLSTLKSSLADQPCPVVLHTPFPPGERTLEKIETVLKSLLGCKAVSVTTREEPSLLCGIRLEIANKIFDGSLKEELERFKNDIEAELS